MGISRKVRQIKLLSLELPAAENGQGRRNWLAHRWLLLGAVSLLVVVAATAYILARSSSDHAKAPKMGWHNNHHAHPQSARHGLAWYELDLNWYGIQALRMLGVARDVKAQKLSPDEDSKASVPRGLAA